MRPTEPQRRTASANHDAGWLSRTLGVYPQKQNGLFMVRVKVFGGRVNWGQWRMIAELARQYARPFPLHVTTRQDIELHNIVASDVPTVQQALAEAGLTTFGACGDTVRNVTICPGCDCHEASVDVVPLALLVRDYLERSPVAADLPRKFKISFSGCAKACARPYLSDLAFVAESDGRFTVVGAGSLGAKPATGVVLYKHWPTQDVLPLCVAALELFAEHGDRANRRRARLRHVRQRLGDDAFKKELTARFDRIRTGAGWPQIALASAEPRRKLQWKLNLRNGNISPDKALCLAEVAEASGAVLRINLTHGIELYGNASFDLPSDLAALADNPIIVACPGAVTCARGLVDCWKTADQIRETVGRRAVQGKTICISGCPNGCAHSAVADIGLLGLLRKQDGRRLGHFRVLTGGDNGRSDRLATGSDIVRAEDVCAKIESLID